jgi:hypothetical protein
VEVPEKCEKDFETVMKGTVYAKIGKVTRTPRLCIYGLDGEVVMDASINELLTCWKSFLGGGV